MAVMANKTEFSDTSSPHIQVKHVIHEVDHYKQRFNWDCGVACVIMVLNQEQKDEMLANFEKICKEEGFGQSTWTIDLCFLLKRFNIKHRMHTTMLGVNEDYRRHSYYNHIIDMDKDRVRRRFVEAPSSDIQVVESYLTMDDIIEHLRSHGPVILLVDAGLLVCDLCKHNKLKYEFRRCFGGGYRGHYVVVVGLRPGPGPGAGAGARGLLYRDPALRARCCTATRRCARAAVPRPGAARALLYRDPALRARCCTATRRCARACAPRPPAGWTRRAARPAPTATWCSCSRILGDLVLSGTKFLNAARGNGLYTLCLAITGCSPRFPPALISEFPRQFRDISVLYRLYPFLYP